MTDLDHLLRTLGSRVLRLVAPPAGGQASVTDVVIHDATDPPPISRGSLVLAVGISPGQVPLALMERVAAEGGTLVVKSSGATDDGLAKDAERLGLAVLAVAPGAAWMQIASLLRQALSDDATARADETLGGVAASDLFAVANAVSALIDAPVTIEDPQARVVAYSGRQDEADDARMMTILGRQVPDDYYHKLQSEGIFRKLYRHKGAIYVDEIGPGVLPRLAVAVRAGDELLGSIWAAVKQKPPADKVSEFADAASFVAIHLLRHRLAADVQRGLQADLISAILSGGTLARDAASRLGLAGDSFRVIAIGMRSGDAVENEVELLRCWDTLSLHLSVSHRRAATGLVGGLVYAVLPVSTDPEHSRRMARNVADGYMARLPTPLREALVVGLGGHARGLDEVPRSRLDADRVLLVIRGMNGVGAKAVGEIEDMGMQVLLQRLSELAAEDRLTVDGPLAALIEHDKQHHTRFVETLQAYLDAFGDIALAANRLNIHHNTLRYRLQKLQQLPGLDLKDAEQRLALQLQLRMLAGANSNSRGDR